MRAVAGGANNQLSQAWVGDILTRRKITFAPDYVINPGGIIPVDAEYDGIADTTSVMNKIDLISDRATNILIEALETGHAPGEIADRNAKRILACARKNPTIDQARRSDFNQHLTPAWVPRTSRRGILQLPAAPATGLCVPEIGVPNGLPAAAMM